MRIETRSLFTLGGVTALAISACVEIDERATEVVPAAAGAAGVSEGGVVMGGGTSTTAGATNGGATNGGATNGGEGGEGVGGAGTAGAVGTICPEEGPSCDGGLACRGVSCCETSFVPGGAFRRANDPELPARVSSFCLDKYEVTVGRFRRFLDDYAAWRASGNPRPGAGEHPKIAESGWDAVWSAENLPPDVESFMVELGCNGQAEPPFPAVPGTAAEENYPLWCSSWYAAFAFCIWDGGRLPTDAEWEYAAAGGGEQRVFPWGFDETEPLPASYTSTGHSRAIEVGAYPAGDARWGQKDMAGSIAEWMLDYYHERRPGACDDCADLIGDRRSQRGGSFLADVRGLRTDAQYAFEPHEVWGFSGIRCARDLVPKTSPSGAPD